MASAKFTNDDKLMGLAHRPGADVTARLLLALTALYVERLNHTQDEQRQYVELALRLIDRVDEMTRLTVAAILGEHSGAPAEIRDRLAALGTVAAPGPAPAPASRHAADHKPAWISAATEALTMENVPIDRRLAAAPHDAADAAFPVTMAPLAVTAPPASYIAPPPAALGEAFFAAPAAERRHLLQAITPDHAAEAAATERDRDRDFGRLDAAALEGKIGEFFHEFEQLLAIPRSLSERIVNDHSGEPFVIAAKAVNMPIAVLQRILLLVNPAVSHSVQRVYDLTDLYHGLDRGAAATLMSLWRAEARPDAPAQGTAPAARPRAFERLRSGTLDAPATGLRSRFGALADRLNGDGLRPRPNPGNFVRRDLRSR